MVLRLVILVAVVGLVVLLWANHNVAHPTPSTLDSTIHHEADDHSIPSIPIGVDIYGETVYKPLVGAGTWQYDNDTAYESVCKAFLAGYTMVDTAWGYKNQVGVGRAIRECWKRPRSELFVLTKIPGGLTAAETKAAHLDNLRQLQLGYVDHLMTHFPADWSVSPDRATPERRQEEWKALQEIYQTGEARSIGVSHYCPQHINDVLQVADIVKPSLNQVEYHVGAGDVDGVRAVCQKNNITFMSFSPLCGPCEYEAKDSLITGDLVTGIAQHYNNVSGSQVALRFIVQQALEEPGSFMGGVIPKSNNLQHMILNRDIFRFQLSAEHMEELRAAAKPAAEAGDCDVP